ncbi:hypothetical protein [Methylomonas sp. UP202]|uniref:hypothetical protein n=1 Tax=Methylomonas sp. UP202 TaxID=3040943 RepID=UPI0024786C8E|nr:hypothetical protein [Methylomonas sp. UP202]WGS86525.1 hypothetical protein QC632_01915 [Methylomonas sp. UP202]
MKPNDSLSKGSSKLAGLINRLFDRGLFSEIALNKKKYIQLVVGIEYGCEFFGANKPEGAAVRMHLSE